MKFTKKDINNFSLSIQALSGFGWMTLVLAGYGLLTWLFTRLPHAIQSIITTLLSGLWPYFGYGALGLWGVLLVALCLFHRLYPSWSGYFRSASATKELKAYLCGSADQTAVVGEDGTLTMKAKPVAHALIIYLGPKTLVALVGTTDAGRTAMESAKESVKEYADGLLTGQHSGAMQTDAGVRYWVYSR